MKTYQHTYPEDLTWMDQKFGATGRLRDLADQAYKVNSWIGGDLYDVVEDWPAIACPTGQWRDVPGIDADLIEGISDEERMRLHLGFGGTEEEVLELRAREYRFMASRS